MPIRLNNADRESTLNQQSPENPIGAFGLTSQYNLYEPQRTNHYEFRVDQDKLRTKLKGLIPYNTYAEDNAGEILTIATIQAPNFNYTINQIDVSRGNTTIHFAGKPQFQGGSFVFNDFIGAGVKDILLAWQKLAFNIDTEKVGLADDYKMQAYITEYTPDHQKVREWKLYGVWVNNVTADAPNTEGDDKVKVTASVVYDFFKVAYDVTDNGNVTPNA